MNYNRVILAGNLTKDPQLNFLPSQTAVAEFGLAINRTFKDADGNKREETCFVDCQAYGKLAENIHKYLKKGQAALVEGRLKLDTWQDKDGNRRSKHRVVVENCQFLTVKANTARTMEDQEALEQAEDKMDRETIQKRMNEPTRPLDDIPF